MVGLERAQVVVDLLTGDPDPRGQRCRRGGLDELRQQPAANGIEGAGRRRRIGDDFDVEHESIVTLDKKSCQ